MINTLNCAGILLNVDFLLLFYSLMLNNPLDILFLRIMELVSLTDNHICNLFFSRLLSGLAIRSGTILVQRNSW